MPTRYDLMPGTVIKRQRAKIARLTADLAEAQERERVLREAVELAMRYLEPTTNCYQVLQSALRAALGEP